MGLLIIPIFIKSRHIINREQLAKDAVSDGSQRRRESLQKRVEIIRSPNLDILGFTDEYENMRMIYWGFNLPFVFLTDSSWPFILPYTDIFWHVFLWFSLYLDAVGPCLSLFVVWYRWLFFCNVIVWWFHYLFIGIASNLLVVLLLVS